jgi:hypothetical protein
VKAVAQSDVSCSKIFRRGVAVLRACKFKLAGGRGVVVHAARQVQVLHVHVSAGELLQLIGECPCTAIDRFRSGSPINTARGCRAPRRDRCQ